MLIPSNQVPIELIKKNLNEELDIGYARITDPDSLKKRRKEAEAKAAEFTSDEWKKLRILAKKNLFFLTETVLGYNKLSPNLHGSVCRWYDQSKVFQYLLLLLPRSHYKSTLFTIGGTVQAHLPDDEGNEPWPYCLGTDGRTIIFHEVHEMAAKFLFSVSSHFLTNKFLMALFPECIPDLKKHRVNKYQLELPRKEIWSEPTVDTSGAGARGQGNHYNILKCDDIIGAEARDSPTQMATNKDWVDNIQSYMVSITEDKFHTAGTRWAFDDTYSHIISTYDDQLKTYIRAVEEPDKEGKLTPIFPEQFTTKSLNILRKNTKVFTAQYLNNPAAAATGIDVSKLQRFYWKTQRSITFYDQSVAQYQGDPHSLRELSTEELDIIFLIDPAVTGPFGFIILGTSARSQHFVLEAIKRSLKPTKQLDLIFEKVLKWRPRLVGIEAVLFSELYEPWLHTEMAARKIKFQVEAIRNPRRSGGSKPERILGLTPFIDAGQIFINDLQVELITEGQQFGVSNDNHLLDALANGPRVWRPFTKRFDDANSSTNSGNLAGRDGSGYTAIRYGTGR